MDSSPIKKMPACRWFDKGSTHEEDEEFVETNSNDSVVVLIWVSPNWKCVGGGSLCCQWADGPIKVIPTPGISAGPVDKFQLYPGFN